MFDRSASSLTKNLCDWFLVAEPYDIFFQAAVYGLGVCAEFGGTVIKPLIGGKFYDT